VDGVVGEVRGDEVGVAGVERLVVGADVIEIADPGSVVDPGLSCSSLG
jgi:hypothetical protein